MISRLLGIALLAAGCQADPFMPPEPARLFQQHCASLAQAAAQQAELAVVGQDGWLFLSAELRHLGAGIFWGSRAAQVSQARRPQEADPLPAILDFHAQLNKLGIELLIVPVPPKALIYPEQLPAGPLPMDGAPQRLDAEQQAFYSLLSAQGLRLLDLTPLFLANRCQADGALYCRQDSHWSGKACVLAAQRIAEAVRALPGYSPTDGPAWTSAWHTLEISGDLWLSLPAAARPEKERIRVRRISRLDGAQPATTDQSSPFILLGDSHNLIFHAGADMQTSSAGLADQLALELGQAVDLVAVRGSGSTPARINLLRRAQKNADYWQPKRVVIWCFAAREFTTSDGWRKVPITPP